MDRAGRLCRVPGARISEPICRSVDAARVRSAAPISIGGSMPPAPACTSQPTTRSRPALRSSGRGLGADLTVQRRNPAVRGAAHPGDQTARPRLRSTLARHPPGAAVGQHQQRRRLLAPALIAADQLVLNTMRFRKGVPVTSDRHFARYLRSVSEFPRGAPGVASLSPS